AIGQRRGGAGVAMHEKVRCMGDCVIDSLMAMACLLRSPASHPVHQQADIFFKNGPAGTKGAHIGNPDGKTWMLRTYDLRTGRCWCGIHTQTAEYGHGTRHVQC